MRFAKKKVGTRAQSASVKALPIAKGPVESFASSLAALAVVLYRGSDRLLRRPRLPFRPRRGESVLAQGGSQGVDPMIQVRREDRHA